MKNSERIKILPEPYRTDIENELRRTNRLDNNSSRLTSSIYQAARSRSLLHYNTFDYVRKIILDYSYNNAQDDLNKASY